MKVWNECEFKCQNYEMYTKNKLLEPGICVIAIKKRKLAIRIE